MGWLAVKARYAGVSTLPDLSSSFLGRRLSSSAVCFLTSGSDGLEAAMERREPAEKRRCFG